MVMPAPAADDPRWSLDLAGGALMDLGCYALHAHRVLGDFAGGEPSLVGARAPNEPAPPASTTGLTPTSSSRPAPPVPPRCSMASDHWDMSLRVIGISGEAFIPDFLYQKYDDRIIVKSAAGERTEHCGNATSYTYQLQAFIDAVRHGAPYRTDADDAVTTMALIDSCYRAIGLQPRPAYAEQLGTVLRHEGEHDPMTTLTASRTTGWLSAADCSIDDFAAPRRPADATCRTTPTPTPSSATC